VLERHLSSRTLQFQDVPVISAFEMMAEAIRISRPFDYKHGGVVMSHDTLGQRSGEKQSSLA
jgi:hypothetical protein